MAFERFSLDRAQNLGVNVWRGDRFKRILFYTGRPLAVLRRVNPDVLAARLLNHLPETAENLCAIHNGAGGSFKCLPGRRMSFETEKEAD